MASARLKSKTDRRTPALVAGVSFFDNRCGTIQSPPIGEGRPLASLAGVLEREKSCYRYHMTTTKQPTLDEAIAAAKQLPEDEQAVLAQDILAEIQDGVLPSARSAEDQAIIAERMSRPRSYVSRDDLMALLRKYNPAL